MPRLAAVMRIPTKLAGIVQRGRTDAVFRPREQSFQRGVFRLWHENRALRVTTGRLHDNDFVPVAQKPASAPAARWCGQRRQGCEDRCIAQAALCRKMARQQALRDPFGKDRAPKAAAQICREIARMWPAAEAVDKKGTPCRRVDLARASSAITWKA